jgi:hypothetical protein
VIETPGDGVIAFQGMQDHTAESIKSLEGFKRAWTEEAQSLSARSLILLRPTIRAPGSELWFGWNPRLKVDPVDVMLRGEEQPTGAVVVRANWSDNPWFPAELEQERQDCLRMQPEQYDHIWEGGYVTVAEGAYYAKQLAEAKAEDRHVAADPLMEYRAFWDIGTRDATAIWIAQFVGREIRVLNYYEATGSRSPRTSHGCATTVTARLCACFRTTARTSTTSAPTSSPITSGTRASGSTRSGTRARAPRSSGSRLHAGCSPRSGSTRQRPKRAAVRLAGITKSGTFSATSASVPNTIGPATAPTHSA